MWREDRGKLSYPTGVSLFEDQFEFAGIDREERGMTSHAGYIRWCVEVRYRQSKSIERVKQALIQCEYEDCLFMLEEMKEKGWIDEDE